LGEKLQIALMIHRFKMITQHNMSCPAAQQLNANSKAAPIPKDQHAPPSQGAGCLTQDPKVIVHCKNWIRSFEPWTNKQSLSQKETRNSLRQEVPENAENQISEIQGCAC
jgi:hypothetical protein